MLNSTEIIETHEQLELGLDFRGDLPSAVAARAIEYASHVAVENSAKHTSVVLGEIIDEAKSPAEAALAIEEAHKQGELGLDMRMSRRKMLFRDLHSLDRISDVDLMLVNKGLKPSAQAQEKYRRLEILLRRKRLTL